MKINMHPSWKVQLNNEFDKPYFKELTNFVAQEYASHECFPPESQIFSTFSLCSFKDVKVVIIGQDPYHGDGQANGLCFSVANEIAHPPSLRNIFKEMESDLGILYPDSGNLVHLAKQGVLLLNATLTVRAHDAGSHQKKGWEQFTDTVIETISKEKEAIVFMLWGGFAKKKVKLIDTAKHVVLTSGHPSPLSANRGYWFGNKHFSKSNAVLKSKNKKEINW
ncbi:MAG: uracil-DNA glycosylase [Gammaproteobacteria bacterium]|jgi:uracil-DNA glycosylase